MLPQGYELPSAGLLLLAGALACFAGQRFFRVVLGLYGFVIGAMVGSSIVGIGSDRVMVIAAAIGGVLGSMVLVFAWFAGVSLLGAGIGVLLAHLVWQPITGSEPPMLAIGAVALAGAVLAYVVQRYVIVIGTAFAGAWTLVLGIGSLLSAPGIVQRSSETEVWILYPTTPPYGTVGVVGWVLLGLVGTAVQLGRTGRK